VAPLSTPAVLLRSHDYGDTSRILRFYTRDHGVLGVMAKGVRGRSGKGAAVLTSFATGELVAFVRPQRDLHTMKDFTPAKARGRLGQDVVRFAGASCLAELVLAHTEQESHPRLFGALDRALDRLDALGAAEVPGAILAGLWDLVDAFGFAPQLDVCVNCGRRPAPDEMCRFELASGGVVCGSCAMESGGPRVGPVARRQLAALTRGEVPADFTHARRHLALVSDFVAHHLVSRPLKSLSFLAGVLPGEAEAEVEA
jgi:DNA repair protein RecO (recombination protein O)